MGNPLKLAPPSDPIEQIHAFAQDLAYGALTGMWTSRLVISGNSFEFSRRSHQEALSQYLRTKWGNQYPQIYLLASFGYLRLDEKGNNLTDAIVTDKAFELLRKPSGATTIFISYSREESSVLALLVLSRLQIVGLNAFLDIQDLKPGEDWHSRLCDEVQKRDYFISLLAPKTLKSEYVREEITWALTHHRQIIPIWHNGYKGENENTELAELLKKNAIVVAREHPIDYDNAITNLLNFFGYTDI